MRKLKIAYGNSRKAKFWSNKTISFEELCERLKTPIRTSETAEEYPKLPKSERDDIKDKGGFVAGHLRDNRRKADKVECRSMLVYDLDNIETESVERIKRKIPCAGCYYTTHSHRPDNPRLRIIIPVTRDMSPDEFNAVARYFASDNDFIDMIDPCSFSPHQLMYWPTCPSNGEYLYGTFEGAWLNPDDVLESHPNWHDCSLLPSTPKESRVMEHTVKQQQDPLTKDGVIGAFCRAYTIEEAIDKFLSDVYEPSAVEGRYDYIPGEGSCGVVIYDDKFAYSHHATDPAGGKLCNAFDLVRIHKFGDSDEKKSYNEACEFAMQQDEVKLQIADDKRRQADEDFANLENTDTNWKTRLRYMPRSKMLENSVWNEMLILNNDPDFANFGYNELAGRIQVTGEVPWERPRDNKFWRDADTAQLKALIDVRYTTFSTRNHDVAFTKVADDRHFHPIRDYLDSLPEWDGVKRVEDIFIKYLKADDTEYVRTVTRKTFAAAVARVYTPGIKFDCVPVLDGEQGIGKSTIVKDLVSPEFYSESLSLTDMDDKSGAEKLQGFWAVEIGELAGMKKADIEKVKAFLSTCDDKYRPSYGKIVESHPRQCIIIATVNGERGYLRDITGNRRFWIIKLHQKKQKKSWNFTSEFRAQFWAEAKEIWKSGEKLYLEDDMLAESEKLQQSAMEVDERVGMVEEYLNTRLPEDWDKMDLFQRRNYLTGIEFGSPTHKGSMLRTEVSNAEIWCECFGKSLQELKPVDSYGIAALMNQIDGWERTTDIRRQPIYGRQRIYKRIC